MSFFSCNNNRKAIPLHIFYRMFTSIFVGKPTEWPVYYIQRNKLVVQFIDQFCAFYGATAFYIFCFHMFRWERVKTFFLQLHYDYVWRHKCTFSISDYYDSLLVVVCFFLGFFWHVEKWHHLIFGYVRSDKMHHTLCSIYKRR